MAKIGFTGFPPGAFVSISAFQAGVSDSAAVAKWGQTNLGSISIVERQSTLKVAPAGLWLEAIDIQGFAVIGGRDALGYDPSFHEITWIWRIEKIDAPGGTVIDTAPLSLSNAATLNLPDVWKDPNIRYGRGIGLALNDPGHYRFTLWCVDEIGTTAEAIHEVEIADPDSFFPAAQTIAWSDNGDFTGAPDGCQCASVTGTHTNLPTNAVTVAGATDDEALSQLMLDTEAGGYTRVVLRRGGTYADVSFWTGAGGTRGIAPKVDNLRFGAFGSGARPQMTFSATYDGRLLNNAVTQWNGVEFVFHDIDFIGTWNQSDFTGASVTLFEKPGQLRNMTMLMHRMNMHGIGGFGLVSGHPDGNVATIFSELDMTHLRGYSISDFSGSAADTTYAGMVGCSIYHDPQGITNIPGTSAQIIIAPVRITGVIKNTCVAMCDFYGRDDRQPAFKHGTAGIPGVYGHFSHTLWEGGTQQFHQALGDGYDYCTNVVIEKAIMIGGYRTNMHMTFDAGGMTVRNILAFQRGSDSGNFYQGFVDIDPGSSGVVAGTYETPIRFHNITYANLMTDAQNPEGAASSFFSAIGSHGDYIDLTDENNVFHQPNENPATDAGPLDLTTAIPGVTPREQAGGYRPAFPVVSRTVNLAPGQSVDLDWPSTADSGYPEDTDDTTPWVLDGFQLIQGNGLHGIGDGLAFTVKNAGQFTVTNNGTRTYSGTYFVYANRSDVPVADVSQAGAAFVPVCRPQTGSPAIDTGDAGLTSYEDAFGVVRPASGNEKGWLLEA